MELNISSCHRVFDKIVTRVDNSLNIKDSCMSEAKNYITHRALIIFKLDVLLIEHREKFDNERLVLFGKNALYHYLFTKKGIPLETAKNMGLHDSLIVLWDDITAYNLPTDVDEFIRKNFYYANNPDSQSVPDEKRYFQDSEWDPEFTERWLS
ncbi:ECs1072 family phage-associated protein [Brenneria rubrifaciens]|nr:hypothetical protein [Brenneria rubrifaciens]